MPWRINVPPTRPSHFGVAVDAALRAARLDPADAEAVKAATLGATALKRLAPSWEVTRADRLIAASISGHANPDGEAEAGAPNDSITITLWRAG